MHRLPGSMKKRWERLRSLETTEKKQNGKLISLFAGRKKWMSAAAAAVLVLCCIPVVQGQLGGTGDQPVIDTLPGQTTMVEQKAAEEAMEAEVQQDASVPNKAVTQAKQQTPQTTNTDTSAEYQSGAGAAGSAANSRRYSAGSESAGAEYDC